MTPVRRLGVVLITDFALVAGTGSVPAPRGAPAPVTTAAAEELDDAVVSYAGAAGASAREILNYWTPERMAAARPVEEVLGLVPEVELEGATEPAGTVPAGR